VLNRQINEESIGSIVWVLLLKASASEALMSMDTRCDAPWSNY